MILKCFPDSSWYKFTSRQPQNLLTTFWLFSNIVGYLSFTETDANCSYSNVVPIYIWEAQTGLHKLTSLFEGTTVDTEGGTLVVEGVGEPRRAAFVTWTTLVTVMVCLMGLVTDCLVTVAPSDGNWFSWFKTNVVVDGWGLCCRTERRNSMLIHTRKQIFHCIMTLRLK